MCAADEWASCNAKRWKKRMQSRTSYRSGKMGPVSWWATAARASTRKYGFSSASCRRPTIWGYERWGELSTYWPRNRLLSSWLPPPNYSLGSASGASIRTVDVAVLGKLTSSYPFLNLFSDNHCSLFTCFIESVSDIWYFQYSVAVTGHGLGLVWLKWMNYVLILDI